MPSSRHPNPGRLRRLTGLVAILSMVAAALPAAPGQSRPLVVATNTILADITREVAGPDAEVRCLVPYGIDLHGFEPRPGDVAALARASLVVANGAGLELWLDRLVAGSGFAGPVVATTAACPLIRREDRPETPAHLAAPDAHGHDHEGVLDPHAWQDPANGIRYVTAIRDALAQVDPGHATAYDERAAGYIARLRELDAWIRERLAAIPAGRRSLLTSHDALAYFGRAYDLEIVPLRGLDLLQEPDARQVAALVDLLRAKKIRAIFAESVSNPKMLEQLARDTGVALGADLYTESVGPPGTPAGTYPGMLRENTTRIAEALSRE